MIQSPSDPFADPFAFNQPAAPEYSAPAFTAPAPSQTTIQDDAFGFGSDGFGSDDINKNIPIRSLSAEEVRQPIAPPAQDAHHNEVPPPSSLSLNHLSSKRSLHPTAENSSLIGGATPEAFSRNTGLPTEQSFYTTIVGAFVIKGLNESLPTLALSYYLKNTIFMSPAEAASTISIIMLPWCVTTLPTLTLAVTLTISN